MTVNGRISGNPTTPRGDGREGLDALVESLYGELREIAHRHRMARDPSSSLATTALVHEAYLKLAAQPDAAWTDRAHFLSVAAIAMRHLLVDRARARIAAKRGGGDVAITLDAELVAADDQPSTLLRIDEALERLAETNARLARVVECRFFGGLTHEEIAAALGVTVRTVERDWAKARLLLRNELTS